MQVTIPHKFTQAEAKSRVIEALKEARTKVGTQATIEREEWQGDTLHFAFTAQGASISGTFEVKEHEFFLDATLPLMLKMFEGRIKAVIQEQATALLK